MNGTWLLAAVFAGSGVALEARDLPEIIAAGELRIVAATGEHPEMFAFGEADAPGFMREMLEGFARLHDLRVEIVPKTDFADVIPTIVGGGADVAVGLIVTEERRRLIAFTTEVLPARHLVVSLGPSPPIRTVEEFQSKRVGVLGNSTWSEAAAAAGMPEEKCTVFGKMDEMLDALEAGRIEATVMSVSDFTLAAKRRPALQGGVFVGSVSSEAWALNKGAPELKQALDRYIGLFRRGPSWSRLVVKYFGEKALSVLGRDH